MRYTLSGRNEHEARFVPIVETGSKMVAQRTALEYLGLSGIEWSSIDGERLSYVEAWESAQFFGWSPADNATLCIKMSPEAKVSGVR